MTITALVYGGVQISTLSAATRTTYAGVSLELCGSTRVGTQWERACCTIDMSPTDALDIAAQLIRAAEQHGTQTSRQVAAVVKRLARTTR